MARILTAKDVTGFRNRVCDAAADLLAEFGDKGFNMRGLARRLGVSAMTAYRYFKDKDEIIATVRARGFARLADRLDAVADRSLSTEERLVALARAYLEFAREEEVYYRSMSNLAWERGAEPQELLQEEKRAREALAKGSRGGGDADVIGLILWSSLHGIASLNLAGKLSDADGDRLASEVIRTLVASFGIELRSPGTTFVGEAPSHRASRSASNGDAAMIALDQTAPL